MAVGTERGRRQRRRLRDRVRGIQVRLVLELIDDVPVVRQCLASIVPELTAT
jgi:hypothetical protein